MLDCTTFGVYRYYPQALFLENVARVRYFINLISLSSVLFFIFLIF